MTEIQDIGDKWAKNISSEFEAWAEDVRLNGRSNTPIVRFDPAPLIEAAMLEAGEAQLGELGKLLGTGIKFDLKSPEAIKWAEKYAAEQVKYIDAGTRAGIRQVTLRGLQEGLSPGEQSKAIRSMVGLLPRHVVAVQSYRENLLASGMDGGIVEKLAGKYASKLLKYRADTIGLTEGHTSTNEGARQVNSDAIQRGIIAEDEYMQSWLTAADDRRCSKCGGMQGKTAKINGDFSGDGRGPPLHPRCRCTTILIKNPDYKAKAKVAEFVPANAGWKPEDRPYEVSTQGITNKPVLDKVLNKFDELNKKFPTNNLFGGFRSLENENVPASIKNNAGEAFVTAWGQAFDKAGKKLRDEIGDPINKIFIYLPPRNINDNVFSEQLAHMGIVHNGSLEGVVTHEFAHVLQLTASNKYGRNIPKTALEASVNSVKESELTPRSIQKNVSMYANGFGAGNLKDSEQFAELFTAIHAPSDKVSVSFMKKLKTYQEKTNAHFEEYGGVGKIV